MVGELGDCSPPVTAVRQSLTLSANSFSCINMMVDVPESVARLLPVDPAKRTRALLESIVINSYTLGIITRGRACELLGMDYWAGDKFFSERGVHVNYDLEEFQHDIGN